ncbi:ATP-binding cassette domain-containing protein [candidate division WOR-3 bacterium]|nr:ATP-binding cassette domain-containing protein [candidate division WOR-3 bacterium]
MSLSVSLKKKLYHYVIDLSFSCEEGKIAVLIGPSGSGKTTVVRMLAGLEKPDTGKISVSDDVWFDSSAKRFLSPQKRRTGYVFQDYTLFPHLSLFDNAAFAAVDKKEVYDLFDAFKISHISDRKPYQVSGGERQRCAFCQALARKPKILLLDEPFSALDFVTRRSLREELKKLKQSLSVPIVYVTHDINEALFLADEMLPIVDGKIDKEWDQQLLNTEADEGKVNKAAREPKLALAY